MKHISLDLSVFVCRRRPSSSSSSHCVLKWWQASSQSYHAISTTTSGVAGECLRPLRITHQHHPFVSVVRDLLGQYTIIGGVRWPVWMARGKIDNEWKSIKLGFGRHCVSSPWVFSIANKEKESSCLSAKRALWFRKKLAEPHKECGPN